MLLSSCYEDKCFFLFYLFFYLFILDISDQLHVLADLIKFANFLSMEYIYICLYNQLF